MLFRSQFGKEAEIVIRGLLDRGKVPIVVGGSGLYVKSAIDGLFDGPGKDPEIRERLEEQFRRDGMDAMLSKLAEVDPVARANMREPTTRRVTRALEVFYITGRPFSQSQREQARSIDYQCMQFGLEWNRKELYKRIESRV